MEQKTYVYVGNWSFEARPQRGKGISVYSYQPETGDMEPVETVLPDVAAGQLFLDEKKGVLYSNDECGERRGEIGGGGYLLALSIDPATGRLTELCRRESLCPEPSYLCLDRDGRYLTVCHCADPWHVTRLVRREDGSFTNEVLFDDTTLALFRVGEDGRIGDMCDAAVMPSNGGIGRDSQVNVDPVSGHIQLVQVISRLHAVAACPSGEMLAVCDKGMDRIYTYRVDRERGRLVYLSEWHAPETACFPRYAAFHPTKPVFYANNENLALLNSFDYDEKTGALHRSSAVYLLPEDPGPVEGKPVGAQDIMVHPNGKTLYCTLSGLNLIVVCSLSPDGTPVPVQRVPCRGVLPRGLALSPDGRFLLCGNMISGDVTLFASDADGRLTDTGRTVPAVSPSAIRFYTVG